MTGLRNIWSSNRQMLLHLPWLFLFFVLPVFPFLVPAAVVVILLTLFFQWKELKMNLTDSSLLLLPILIYGLYLIGLVWTDTPGMPAIVIERKLSFLIFPLLFLFLPPFTPAQRKLLFGAFCGGALLHSLISIALSFGCYLDAGNRDCFYSSAFSFLLHPSYSALYDVIVICWLGISVITDLKVLSLREKLLYLLLIAWFSLVLFLLASKAGLISLLVVVFILLVYFALRHKKIKQVLVTAGIILALGISSLLITTVPLERFKSVFSSSGLSDEELFEKYRETMESNAVRRMVWICAKEIIAENPYGVGSGDANAELYKKYEEKGMTEVRAHELNAHNQYYQVTLALGYPGLFLLVTTLVAALIHAVRRKKILFLSFLIIVAINLAVESMFETQAGVVFIVLFFCFIYTEGAEPTAITEEANLQ